MREASERVAYMRLYDYPNRQEQLHHAALHPYLCEVRRGQDGLWYGTVVMRGTATFMCAFNRSDEVLGEWPVVQGDPRHKRRHGVSMDATALHAGQQVEIDADIWQPDE